MTDDYVQEFVWDAAHEFFAPVSERVPGQTVLFLGDALEHLRGLPLQVPRGGWPSRLAFVGSKTVWEFDRMMTVNDVQVPLYRREGMPT